MTDHGDTTRLILSHVEKQLGRFGGLRSTTRYEAQLVPADQRQERSFHGHLAIYYDTVIAATRGAEALLIFGPGEAKDELRQRLAKTARSRQIVEFETIDKMTDRQIAAKVRRHFPNGRAAGSAPILAARRGRRPRRPLGGKAALGGTA